MKENLTHDLPRLLELAASEKGWTKHRKKRLSLPRGRAHDSTVTETKSVPFTVRLIWVPTLAMVYEIEPSVGLGGLHL